MYFLGFSSVFTVILLRPVLVLGETCSFDSGRTQSCNYGCCDQQCCSEPFWNWYIIIGIAVAGIFGLIFLVGVGILVCVYCVKANKSTPSRGRLSEPNRVYPSTCSVYNIHTTSRLDRTGQPMPPPPPYTAYVTYEAPPSYEDVQNLSPQTRSAVVPQPRLSRGVPHRTRTVYNT